MDGSDDRLIEVSPLHRAVERFYDVLYATTVPAGQDRRVDGVAHAIALSEASDVLFRELVALHEKLHDTLGKPTGVPPGLLLLESDSPDGPWEPLPPDAVEGSVLFIGPEAVPASVMAAIEGAARVLAVPQGGTPAGRWRADDVVPADTLERLGSVRRLLCLGPSQVGAETLGVKPGMAPAASGAKDPPAVTASDDFAVITVDAKEYIFTGKAQKVMRELFTEARRGDNGLALTRLATKIGSTATRFRVDTCFRQKDRTKHPGLQLIQMFGGDRVRLRPDLAAKWRSIPPVAHQ